MPTKTWHLLKWLGVSSSDKHVQTSFTVSKCRQEIISTRIITIQNPVPPLSSSIQFNSIQLEFINHRTPLPKPNTIFPKPDTTLPKPNTPLLGPITILPKSNPTLPNTNTIPSLPNLTFPGLPAERLSRPKTPKYGRHNSRVYNAKRTMERCNF